MKLFWLYAWSNLPLGYQKKVSNNYLLENYSMYCKQRTTPLEDKLHELVLSVNTMSNLQGIFIHRNCE